MQEKKKNYAIGYSCSTGYRFLEVSRGYYVESSGKFNQVFLINGDDLSAQ